MRRLSPPLAGTFSIHRNRWLGIGLAVLLVHCLVLIGLERLLGLFQLTQPVPEVAPISFQMIQEAGRPAPRPRPSSPSIISQSESEGQPDTKPAQAEPLTARGPQPQQQEPSAATPIPLANRTPTLSELPRVGGVALNAFWGDHSSGSLIAKGAIELSFPSEGRYEIRLVTEAVGWASMFASSPLYAKTVGSLGPGGFRPERYTHKTPRGREELSEFDYENNKIRYSSLKEPLQMLNGIQDRLSFMMQLAWMMKVDPDRFGLGQFVRIPMAGRKQVEEVDFLVLSDADLVLPGGTLVPTLHLSSMRKGDRFSGQIDVWLDRTDRLLPVRIRFEEVRGQVLDLLTVRAP
jgi:hypothetical protein